MKQVPQRTKENKAVTVWLTDEQVQFIDEQIRKLVKPVPGARMSRGAYIKQLLTDKRAKL